jgi:hypothetical protein
MKTPTLSRKAIREGLEQTPFVDIMGKQVTQQITPKMQAFALEVAKGASGSAALRKAYNTKGTPKTQANNAHRLRKRADIKATIEAYELALEAQKYSTPAHLRALVINSLVGVLIDPDSNASQITNAAKVLGTVTEVAAFTELKTVTTITSSEDARARVMMQLRDMMKSSATDAVEIEADSLLKELAGEDTTPTTPIGQLESLTTIHSVPHESSEVLPISKPTPTNTFSSISPDDPTESTPL